MTNLTRLRLSYSFTTRVFVQALAQYNDRARLWSSRLRGARRDPGFKTGVARAAGLVV